MTRAEKRKRRLVWAKTAPINYGNRDALLTYGRYVPGGKKRDDMECPVWDRKLGRELEPHELVKVKDRALQFETFGTS